MESKYNIDSFERFLKEKTDEFRMYPSKRVWYSIYNNMHPGNRLPSISMCIILIFSLLLVGYLNTNTSKELSSNQNNSIILQAGTYQFPFDNKALSSQYVVGSNQQAVNQQTIFISQLPVDKNSTVSNFSGKISTIKNNTVVVYAGSQKASSYNYKNNNKTLDKLNTGNPEIAITTPVNDLSISTIKETVKIKPAVEESINTVAVNNNRQIVTQEKNILSPGDNDETIAMKNKDAGKQNSIVKNQIQNISTPAIAPAETIAAVNDKDALSITNTKTIKNGAEENKIAKPTAALSESDKAWIENYALYNKPAAKKWAGKVSWQAYFAPSLVYRTLHNNAAGKYLGNNLTNINNTEIENAVIQKPSFGVETGLALQYDLLKRVKVKVGVQLNYTRYNTHAFENYHPVATSLTMNSDNNESVYEVFRTTPFSNATGLSPVKLHNESYQISLPIGADLKLAAVDNIVWYVGATIQPTIVVYGRSFLLSTDRRNYVQDKSLLNRFNLNAGFETYISFKTSNYTWQVGPQIRSQIFSTNTKLYSVEERLQNYGFKIAISKKL